jgi:hypothetical protein
MLTNLVEKSRVRRGVAGGVAGEGLLQRLQV